MGSYCLMGTEFLFKGIKKVLEKHTGVFHNIVSCNYHLKMAKIANFNTYITIKKKVKVCLAFNN